MLAYAAGDWLGVAKSVSPVVVRRHENTAEAMLSGTARVLEATDRRLNPDAPPLSVFSMSGGVYYDGCFEDDGSNSFEYYSERLHLMYRQFAGQGVLPIVASGNSGLVSSQFISWGVIG